VPRKELRTIKCAAKWKKLGIPAVEGQFVAREERGIENELFTEIMEESTLVLKLN
jgi:hypothetical protein